MLRLQTWFQIRWTDDEGASLVEYALLLVLIAVVAIAAIAIVGNEVDSTFDEVGNSLKNA